MSIISDSDLATFLGRPAIAGTPQAVLAANIGGGVVLDWLKVPGLTTTTVTELVLDGPANGTSTIVIPGYPVTAVTDVQELVIDQVSGPQWNDLVEGVNYTWSEYGILSKFGSNDSTDGQKISGTVMGAFPGQFWTHLQQGIKVSYTYGLATVPYTVQYVALSLAARIYTNPTNLMRESIGGYEYSYNPRGIANFATLAPDEIAVLGMYSDGVVG